MVLRLWQAERPRAVFIGWDTLTVPTYRHELLSGYQAGREFDPELLEQLDIAPGLLEAAGFVCAKAAGFEADDFLAAAVASERRAEGASLVATSDRDAFQLAADDVTILQPVKGVSELARIGPAEVRERYGVEPDQVPDFIALRGDPSDKIPGARGVGAKTAASLLAEYASLDALLEAGRFSAEADALRSYRHIATLDPTAPVPALPDREPDWRAGAAAADALGLGRLAGGSRRPHRADLAPRDGAPAPDGSPSPPRAARAAGDPPRRARRGTRRQTGEPGADRARPRFGIRRHDCVDRRGDVARRRHSREPDDVGGGAARGGMLDRGGRRRRLRARPPARPPRSAGECDGLLHLRQRRGRCTLCPGNARHRARRDRRLGRASRERHRRDLPGRRLGSRSLAPPVAVLPWQRRARTSDESTLNVPLPAGSGDAEYAAAFRDLVEPAVAEFGPDSSSSQRGSTRTSRTHSPGWR